MTLPVYETMYPFNALDPRHEYPKIVWGFAADNDRLFVEAYLFRDWNDPEPKDSPLVSFSMPEDKEEPHINQALSVIAAVELSEYETLMYYMGEIWNRIYQNHQLRVMRYIKSGEIACSG